MILECHRALTGMPPFVVAMKEAHYGRWRLRADDDDGDDDDDDDIGLTSDEVAVLVIVSGHRMIHV